MSQHERKPDDESVIKITQKYVDAENKIRKILFQPTTQTLTAFEKQFSETLNNARKSLDKANKEFVNSSLKQSYAAAKESIDRLYFKQKDDSKQTSQGKNTEQSYNGQKRFNDIRRGAFIDLNDGMNFATEQLRRAVKKTIRDLDDGNKNLKAFTDAIRQTLANENIFEVNYKNGASIKLEHYVKMLSRSSRIETANVGSFQRALELGSDLVKCTEISPTCDLCAALQGRVYSISGKDKRFPALYETALAHGYSLIHPNCRHEFLPYFEELQEPEQVKKDIQISNQPFKDSRTKRERDDYAKWQEWNRQINAENAEYTAMQKVLGADMPYKSLGGFRRAKRANSDGYQDIRNQYIKAENAAKKSFNSVPTSKKKKVIIPRIEVPQKDKVISLSEASNYAKEAEIIIDKHTAKSSKWSGKILIDANRCAKENATAFKDWNCDVVIKGEVEKKVIIHELLHARSVSHFTPTEYVQHQREEEGAVEFLAQEIAKKEGLTFNPSYAILTKHLRAIQATTRMWKDDYELAHEFYNVPMDRRGNWLSKKVQAFLAIDKTLSDVDRRNLIIHGNNFWGRL